MTDSPQTLQEFTTNLLSDLESGAISVHEAIAAAAQYSYLREAIVSNKEVLAQAELQSEAVLSEALTKIVAETLAGIAELPNFGGQLPSVPLEEKEIRRTAELREFAIARLKESSQAKPGQSSDRRRAFIHALVERYSSRVPLSETQVGASFDSSLMGAAGDAKTRQTKERFAELLVASVEVTGGALSNNQKEKLLLDTKAAFATDESFISESLEQTGKNLALYEALIANPNLKRPDVFIDIALNAPTFESFDTSMLRAQKLAGVAEGLDEHGNKKVGKLQFFSADAAKGVAGGIQKGADGILSMVGEPIRDMVLHEKVNGTLRSMLTKPQKLFDRLGENFVRSSLFTHITQDLTKQLSDRTPAGGGQMRSVVGDFVSSVFRGPLDPALTRAANGRLLDYFELTRANMAAPQGKKFLLPGVLPWNVFRTYDEMRRLGGSRTSGYAPSLGRSLFFGLGSGAIGNFLGNTLSSLVDRTTSFLFTNPFIPRQISQSRRAASLPTKIADDMPLMVALTVIIVLLVFFIFPSPLNLAQISHSSKASALFAALFNKEADESTGVIGPTTLTCANINGVHEYQTNLQWAFRTCEAARPDVPACSAPTFCTIGASGCGSTSATMILKSFGASVDVPTVWDAQHKNNGYEYYTSNSCRSFWSGVLGIVQGAGLSTAQIGINEVENVLKECGLVLAFVNEKWASIIEPTGHIIVITGISNNGGEISVTTLDPLRPPGYVSRVTSTPTKPGDISINGLFSVVK